MLLLASFGVLSFHYLAVYEEDFQPNIQKEAVGFGGEMREKKGGAFWRGKKEKKRPKKKNLL